MPAITLDDKRYPSSLKKIGKDAPKKLYYKGEWDKEIFENCLGVVGSRSLTNYGRRVTEYLVTEVAAAMITIVSGFMYGGDVAGHRAAVKAGGRTIAVMPCGIDLIHPEEQKDLYHQILENKGLIISEYKGKMSPTNWTYPRRNRIVAGLSQAVLVTEAGLKSGTLITANFAKKFGRKIFAVPGPLTSEVSRGTLELIKEEGVEMVTSSKEILKEFGIGSIGDPAKIKRKGMGGKLREDRRDLKEEDKGELREIKGIEREILERLRREPLEADELARSFGISSSKLGTTLSLMQLKGLITQEGNKYYPMY